MTPQSTVTFDTSQWSEKIFCNLIWKHRFNKEETRLFHDNEQRKRNKKTPLYIIIFYILGYLIATFFIWKRFRQIRRKWKPSNETMFLVKSVCWKRVRQSFQMMGWINWLHTNYLLCQDIVLHTWCNFTTNMIYT